MMTVLYANAMVDSAPMMLNTLVGVSSPNPVSYKIEPGALLAPAIRNGNCHLSIRMLITHWPIILMCQCPKSYFPRIGICMNPTADISPPALSSSVCMQTSATCHNCHLS